MTAPGDPQFDAIAAALRNPQLRRPVVGIELRQAVIEMRGRASDVRWTATVPQLAEAVYIALYGRPPGT